MSSEAELLRLLRARLSDDRHSRLAFTLRLEDSTATEAVAEVVNGYLRTTVSRSSRADDLVLDLSAPHLNTVRRLIDFLNSTRCVGYAASPDAQYDGDHPSADLRIEGFGDIRRSGASLLHRRFSDPELLDLLRQGCQRHNLTYTPATVPPGEYEFVLTYSHIGALRMLASNAAKRRGLSESVTDLLAIAAAYESSNLSDHRRQQRAVPVAPIRDEEVGTGDIVQGDVFRRSARTGYQTPQSASLPPTPPEFFPVEDSDCTDTTLSLSWKRSRSYNFYSVELWRDTREDVRRGFTQPRRIAARNEGEPARTTSKLVFQSYSSFHGVEWWGTTIDEHGQLTTRVIDGANSDDSRGTVQPPPLEPESTYYYRLYFTDRNGEVVDSVAIRATTKPLRARLDETAPLDVTTGTVAGGTAVTLTGIRFHEGMEVFLGDKPVVDLTIVSATEATFETPSYSNPAMVGRSVDLVVRSYSGLEDIRHDAWEYTA